MTQETVQENKKIPHEHSYYPTEIYSLEESWYIVVKMECSTCGEVYWDKGSRVDNDS